RAIAAERTNIAGRDFSRPRRELYADHSIEAQLRGQQDNPTLSTSDVDEGVLGFVSRKEARQEVERSRRGGHHGMPQRAIVANDFQILQVDLPGCIDVMSRIPGSLKDTAQLKSRLLLQERPCSFILESPRQAADAFLAQYAQRPGGSGSPAVDRLEMMVG